MLCLIYFPGILVTSAAQIGETSDGAVPFASEPVERLGQVFYDPVARGHSHVTSVAPDDANEALWVASLVIAAAATAEKVVLQVVGVGQSVKNLEVVLQLVGRRGALSQVVQQRSPVVGKFAVLQSTAPGLDALQCL